MVGGLLTPQQAIAPVRWTIAAERKVGRRKAGLLCAPAGALHWRDIGMPDGQDAAQRIEAALAREAPAPGRLSAVITDLKLDVCEPHFGGGARLIGLKRVLKGRGSITVAWRIDDGDARVIEQSIAFGKTETALSDIVLAALADSARAAMAAPP